MQWFGRAFGAPYEADTPYVPTPVGEACMHCGEPIGPRDDGFLIQHIDEHGASLRPWHYACHLRGVVGGANHQLGKCTCCGGTMDPDPAGLSKRDAAALAVRVWQSIQAGRRMRERGE